MKRVSLGLAEVGAWVEVSLEGQRCQVSVNQFLLCVCLPGSKARTVVTVVFNTSHSSEVQLSAASLEGGGCMILRSWVAILTFSNKAIWK